MQWVRFDRLKKISRIEQRNLIKPQIHFPPSLHFSTIEIPDKMDYRPNQGRDALNGHKWEGSGLKSKSNHTETGRDNKDQFSSEGISLTNSFNLTYININHLKKSIKTKKNKRDEARES